MLGLHGAAAARSAHYSDGNDGFQAARLLLTLARAQSLQAGLVAKGVLAGLHHQLQTAVDVLLALLLRVQRPQNM